MTLALSIIREEHRSLSAVIRSLDLLAREARDREPDYELFTVMLDYVEGFSDRFHHPKEDELVRDLRYLLSRCRVGGAAAVDVFAAAVGEYVDFYWRHMRLEEDVVMPLAERRLTPEDWEPIDAAFQANDDPLFGARPREEFRRLFGLILNRAPAPVGVGPERKTP